MNPRPQAPVLAPCEPVGSLEPWVRCTHPRECVCGASLHLSPSFEAPGFHSWQWTDEGGARGTMTYPWGSGPEPVGWWESLAERDVAAYSMLSARQGLGMLGAWHSHAPDGTWRRCPDCPPPVPAPECHGKPMMATVEGWRCREALRVVPNPNP